MADELTLTPPSPTDKLAYPADFERFWAAWPSPRQAKVAAFRAWRKLKPPPTMVDAIIAGIVRDQRTIQWLEGYRPLPATYLNGRRWEDEPGPRKRSATPWRPAGFTDADLHWCDHTPRCGTRGGHELRLKREAKKGT